MSLAVNLEGSKTCAILSVFLALCLLLMDEDISSQKLLMWWTPTP